MICFIKWSLVIVLVLCIAITPSYNHVFSSSIASYNDNVVVYGADNGLIILNNNSLSIAPSYQLLTSFLNSDNTDSKEYVEGIFTCADSAELLHNNSELAGILCYFVVINISSDNGTDMCHALCMYNTTDRGTVFIDDTVGDNVANVIIGELYTLEPLFIKQDYGYIGTVTSINIVSERR